RVFKIFPDAHFGDAKHFVAGDRGGSEWLFAGTTSEGKKVEVKGCDVFTFRGDKIAVKESFFKDRLAYLLDDLIRPPEQGGRDRQAQRPRRLHVDHQLELRGLLDGQLARS